MSTPNQWRARYNFRKSCFASHPLEEVALSKGSKDAQALAEAKFKRKEVQARDATKAMAEYEATAIATREKTARLKQLRLAKEEANRKAAEQEPAPAKPKAGAKKKM